MVNLRKNLPGMFAQRRKEGAFLTRLARDTRGNALAIVALSVIPMIGMIGGGLDLSRLYLVKTRLQHACDAGALSGRKQMGAGAWTTTGTTSSNQVALNMFNGNFPAGAYGATGVTRSYSEANGVVSGTASATVPMTLMKVLDQPDRTLTVTCTATQSVPNTDVVFVLDTTESMGANSDGTNSRSRTQSATSTSKITTLKAAVKCFYEALTKIETSEATCDPIVGVATSARLRFGIVPYATNVNIKNLGLPDSYFAQSWSYQSRTWRSSAAQWRYKQQSFALTGFKNTSTSLSLAFNTALPRTVTWDGCAEENAPVSDVDTKPDTGTSATAQLTKYAPMLPDIVYYRRQVGGGTVAPASLNSADYDTTNDVFDASEYPYYSCPAPAWPLQSYGSTQVSTFNSRVDALYHAGNTRHDIGMLWGGRLLSPGGVYSGTNTTAPNGGRIYRHLIFMTDGNAKANECDYATYGVPWFDKREVSAGTTVTGTNCNALYNENPTLTNNVYSRLATLCSSIKAKDNTILWVISFGSGSAISTDTKNKLKSCASGENYFFDATTDVGLDDAFKRIASQINQLRLAS